MPTCMRAETKDGVKDLTGMVNKVDHRLRDLYRDSHNLCLTFIGQQSTLTVGRLKTVGPSVSGSLSHV